MNNSLTASHARFLSDTHGSTKRFADFAVDSFDACRLAGSSNNQNDLTSLWNQHFADTGFSSGNERFYHVVAEILLARSVDAFQYYLADVIAWALWRRPAVVHLKEEATKLALESGSDIDTAARRVAWSYAETLSFRGFGAMVDFIENIFEVSLVLDVAKKARLRRIIATRNMIAHNRSMKNARYCKDVGESSDNIGQSVRPTLAEARCYLQELADFVQLTDNALSNKVSGFLSL